jgi:hypothetical protein
VTSPQSKQEYIDAVQNHPLVLRVLLDGATHIKLSIRHYRTRGSLIGYSTDLRIKYTNKQRFGGSLIVPVLPHQQALQEFTCEISRERKLDLLTTYQLRVLEAALTTHESDRRLQ